MTLKTLILTAAAGAFVFGVGAAYAQQQYDPSVRKEFDDRSVSAHIPIFWQRDPAGKLVLDAQGQPILITSAPTAEVIYVSPTAPYTPTVVAVLPEDINASVVVVDPVDYSLAPRLEIVANAPVPDTPANRARYGGPMSRAGRLTAPVGN